MGNRAVILFPTPEQLDTEDTETTYGVYLHWNGGPDSVDALLDAAKQINWDGQCDAVSFGIAAMALAGGASGTSGPASRLDLDNGDNGAYWVIDGEVVKRTHRGSKSPREGYTKKDLMDTIAQGAGELTERVNRATPVVTR